MIGFHKQKEFTMSQFTTTRERLESTSGNIDSMQRNELIAKCRNSELMNYYTVTELNKCKINDLRTMLRNIGLKKGERK
jgi:hypothetical protein